jgi:hypothetical protein
MEESIVRVIEYFGQFSFAPSLDEVHTFLEDKITKKALRSDLHHLVKKQILAYKLIRSARNEKIECFALISQEHLFPLRIHREEASLRKIETIQPFIKHLKFIPFVKYVGLSGSIAMLNAGFEDDIDLFMITSVNRMWTARFFVLMLAQFHKLRGEHNPNMICLNLIFDERDLFLPTHKKNEYTAHELIQLKTIINKDKLYEKLLVCNAWVFNFFPNIYKPEVAQHVLKKHLAKKSNNKVADIVEIILKKVQLSVLKKRKTKELIIDTQLWLIKDDFEAKLSLKLRQI